MSNRLQLITHRDQRNVTQSPQLMNARSLHAHYTPTQISHYDNIRNYPSSNQISFRNSYNTQYYNRTPNDGYGMMFPPVITDTPMELDGPSVIYGSNCYSN